ncbi:MAG: class F sortase [Ferrimicrobium sp.]|jgi:sortase (surface protein transpeptidase)|nr:class F sortase [Ferrimicrobium sp.]
MIVAGVSMASIGYLVSPARVIAAQARVDHRRAVAQAQHIKPVPTSQPATPSKPLAASPGQLEGIITIPALDVQAPIYAEPVARGLMTIPADVHHVGWDLQTSTPGSSGVALLAGHVNWVGQGEGALGQIGQLVAGDTIQVTFEHTTTRWVVSAAPRLSSNTVTHPSLFNADGPPRLALVTCGGPFSETASGGSYADNVIVMATLIGN